MSDFSIDEAYKQSLIAKWQGMDEESIFADFFSLLSQNDGGHHESLSFRVNTHIVLRGEDGLIKDERFVHNTICTSGKNIILGSTGTAGPAVFNKCAIGSGTATPAIGDTTLLGQITIGTAAVTNPNASTLQFDTTFGAGIGTNAAITESGLFNVTALTNLFARQTFGAIAKAAGDSLSCSWSIS